MRMRPFFSKKYRCCQCGSGGDVADSKSETSDEESCEDDADVSDEEPGENDSDESDQYYAPLYVLYYDDLWDLIQDLCEVYFGNYEEDYEDEDEEFDETSESDETDETDDPDEDDPEMTGTKIKRTAHNPDRAGRCPNQLCRHRWCHKCPIIREDSSEKVLEKAKKGKKRLHN
ncbi:hypothetical protein J4E83_000773 [Alternaria metachromatica]|uniref:uncharacterized protein n=1 Tax=Alternaria metachromatica TaxID=283354 RepID=UPI0020C3F12B|nr:uncharacterized protein J4E83_000773 [Alternaria metachromatica]KAI4637955.1 hypothetical protein J4E83_000773 [Alternaria metachromatica]